MQYMHWNPIAAGDGKQLEMQKLSVLRNRTSICSIYATILGTMARLRRVMGLHEAAECCGMLQEDAGGCRRLRDAA